MQQLVLFEEIRSYEMEKKIETFEKQIGNIRRGLFARHGELMKLYLENKQELETLKKALCQAQVL